VIESIYVPGDGVTVPKSGFVISYVTSILVTVIALFPAKSSPSSVNSYVSPSTIPGTVMICSVNVVNSAPLKEYV